MRPNVSKFRIYEENARDTKVWSNFASENVLLHTHRKVQPWTDLTEPIMQYITSSAPSLVDKRTPLQDFLMKSGRTRMIDTDYVKWRLKGTGELKTLQKENLIPDIDKPGMQNAEFPIKLEHDWFVEGDVLAPDAAKECQVLVEGLPVGDGTGFIYTVKLVDRNPRSYFPPSLLEPNLTWIKIDSVYGEASRGYGSTFFTGMSYIEFMSELTDYGKQIEVTNKAHNLNLKMTFCDDKGQEIKDYPDQIISYIEAEFLAQSKWEKEMRLFYGRSDNKSNIDSTSGFHRRIGPGLLEFLEDGNVIPYSVTGGSIDMFEDFLQSIWFDRVPPDKRNIVAYTGQGGLKLWRDWLAEKYNVQPTWRSHTEFTKPAMSYDPKNYSGYKIDTTQPTETAFFPFGSFRVEHWPVLDSLYLNGSNLHPETGLPMSSYEFIILDYGMGDGGSSNIELLKRKDSEAYTYKCGTWSPAGPINGSTGKAGFVCSGPERSYILYHTDSLGIRVKDVTLTAWFVPSTTF